MFPALPYQLQPYANELEKMILALTYLEAEDGHSWFTDNEATELLHEADLVSRAYIEYTQKHPGFHDRYFTNLAKYLLKLSQHLSKQRCEELLATQPLSEIFSLMKDRPATGTGLGVALIDALESIFKRIQELKIEQFVATKSNNAALRARRKAELMGQVKELYDRAFASDIPINRRRRLESAEHTLKNKRIMSINNSTEWELDQLIWRCHRIELVLDDVHEMMDRDEDDKSSDLWRTSTLTRCQLASSYCQELNDVAIKYLDFHTESMLPWTSTSLLPVIDANQLMSSSYVNLLPEHKIAAKEFTAVVAGAINKAESRKLRAEVECVLAQNMLDLRERQLAAPHPWLTWLVRLTRLISLWIVRRRAPMELSNFSPSVLDLLEQVKDYEYSLDEYVKLVVDLRVKEARRISVLSEVWNRRLIWTLHRESREQQEKRMNLDLLDPNVQKCLKDLIADGRDLARIREPLGWWLSDSESEDNLALSTRQAWPSLADMTLSICWKLFNL